MCSKGSSIVTALAMAAAMAGTGFAVAEERDPLRSMVIEPSANRVVDRTIMIDPSTRRIDVEGGETVRFVVRGPGGSKEFVRLFNTYQHQPAPFALTQIGPQNTSTTLGGGDVRVFVSPDPRYAIFGEGGQ